MSVPPDDQPDPPSTAADPASDQPSPSPPVDTAKPGSGRGIDKVDPDAGTGPDADAPRAAVDPDAAKTTADPVSRAEEGPRKGVRWGRISLVVGLVLLLAAGGLGTSGWWYARSVGQQIERVDVFQTLPEAERPAKVIKKALNLLVVGSDSRTTSNDGARTDTIILVHLPASRDRAHLISIPRDTWTTIPKSPGGRRGGSKAKINAAFARGGVPLLVRTVEYFTEVRIDHVVLIDFAGFEQIIDAVGGVEVSIDRPFTSIHPPYRRFTPGKHHLDGAAALDYARQRKQFADGDFRRVRHQQQIISAVLQQISRNGFLSDPARLDNLIRATADAVSIDQNLSIFDLAWTLRELRSGDLIMLTSPSKGTGRVGKQSVVFPDLAAAARLYRAVKDDSVDAWLAAHPPHGDRNA